MMAARSIALVVVFLLTPGLAWAQVGTGYDTSLPIEITADSLEVQQEEQLAVFTGNVDAVQGELNLRADRLVVHYRTNAADSNAIRLIEAFGNVFRFDRLTTVAALAGRPHRHRTGRRCAFRSHGMPDGYRARSACPRAASLPAGPL